ncbi:deoxyribodipyrimidine photo-lyase/cryptochrome family protein (plasmid) [Halomicrobium sp. IBSBa]|uniref:FAD-binding domain-containing protein n=1 Tax=Halomicrobium sp. IBSBa TaxID=2778916 RepID=UPI001ABF76EC|nr:cryptochrome/deoxyribodipyrimidine photo-lyase family protein [Halomicrobium sp. IBSBa]MBO4248955.1 deoxyribodipyrimidine photo-lyase/cryptochrome family protein [Halomicrobium sp. IBSBa]
MSDGPTAVTPGDVPTTTNGCVVWHRRNLRTTDHGALSYASEEYDTVLPLFVFDPQFYGDDGLACDARLQYLHESVESLRRLYEAVGGTLSYAHGDPLSVLSTLAAAGWDVVATADPTARYGRQRDDRAAAHCDVRFVDSDGLVRDQAWPREGWSDHVEAWFESSPYCWDPDDVSFASLPETVSVADIERTYDIHSAKTTVPPGGRAAGARRLRQFVADIEQYPGNISAPTDARTGTSGLSPSLRFGSLSVREVYQYVMDNAPSCAGREMFVSRLYWNKHYHQKLEDWSGWTTTAVNPAMRDCRAESHDPELVTAWKQGTTGFPMVDASMRCLVETGWLNFRMRAMCASVFADLFQQPWQIGADFYHYHLIDADPAINYTQWQSQAGTVGTNLMRIYNPIKQVRDNDPDGTFVSTYVPELAPLPTEHLPRPEKTPLHVQEACGVEIGTDYPYPVVEYEAARQRAIERYERLEPAARQALEEPAVARRASLSSQPRPPDGSDDTSTATDESPQQRGLDAYTETDRK